MDHASDGGVGRPKLRLQPRRASADLTASTTAKLTRASPFGDARPREQVIAEREGKDETEVLREQTKKYWNSIITLTEAQRKEKMAAEAMLSFARKELERETDSARAKVLQDEVESRKRELNELLKSFEKILITAPQNGVSRRSSERKHDDDCSSSAYAGNRGGRERGQGGLFRDMRGGSRGRSRLSKCYNCRQVGHFSRECPNGGSRSRGRNFAGGRAGGRQCYSCGQKGHFSRECPINASNYGSGGSGYISYTGDTFSYGCLAGQVGYASEAGYVSQAGYGYASEAGCVSQPGYGYASEARCVSQAGYGYGIGGYMVSERGGSSIETGYNVHSSYGVNHSYTERQGT